MARKSSWRATANGSTGVFYANWRMAAQGGSRRLRASVLSRGSTMTTTASLPPKAAWQPNDAGHPRDGRSLRASSREQMYWAEFDQRQDGDRRTARTLDEICWRFQARVPVDGRPRRSAQAARAATSRVPWSTQPVSAGQRPPARHAPGLRLLTFATGGGGDSAEYTSAKQLSGKAADAHVQDTEGGDSNVFISHARAACKGRELYERFKDRNSR